MSDLIAPITVKDLAKQNLDILQLLFELRMELRIQNELLVSGLNMERTHNLDDLRQDCYYSGSDGEANTR